jgi:hypothetical protein
MWGAQHWCQIGIYKHWYQVWVGDQRAVNGLPQVPLLTYAFISGYFLGLLFSHEDGGTILLRNMQISIGIHDIVYKKLSILMATL